MINFGIFSQYLDQASGDNKEVKPIEQTLKIEPNPKGKDLQQQFQREENDEDNVGNILQNKGRVKVRMRWKMITWKLVSQTG